MGVSTSNQTVNERRILLCALEVGLPFPDRYADRPVFASLHRHVLQRQPASAVNFRVGLQCCVRALTCVYVRALACQEVLYWSAERGVHHGVYGCVSDAIR